MQRSEESKKYWYCSGKNAQALSEKAKELALETNEIKQNN